MWKPIAWLGGRSLQELRDFASDECATSVMAGSFALISVMAIFAGQYLFWGHLPHTTEAALGVALFLVAIYTLFYRSLMRAMEVMGRVGKALTYAAVFVLASVNALLAGHELAILPFVPQIESQVKYDAARGVTEYGDTVSQSLGIPGLRQKTKELEGSVAQAMLERQRVPEDVQSVRVQAQSCDIAASGLQARIPSDRDDPGYIQARRAWREMHGRCQKLHGEASRLLAAHRKRVDESIGELEGQLGYNTKKLGQAQADYDHTLARDSRAIQVSATTGFARHKALWAAAESGKIPKWAVVGFLLLALILEGMAFLIKAFLPDDLATACRKDAAAKLAQEISVRHKALTADTELLQAREAMRMQTARAYHAKIPAVVASMDHIIAEDVTNDIRDVVLPGLRTELAATAFGQANERVKRAQVHAGKPSLDLIRRLKNLANSARNMMRFGFGSSGAR